LRCALDPAAFAVERLGFQPDPWQAVFLRSAAPRLLLNITRQGGKSTAAAVLALHTALYRPRALVLLVSPSLRQSGELFRKVREFRARLDPPPPLDEDNQLSCTFANGARVVSLPGDESTVRGYSAPRLIVEDEASRVPDELYRTLRPMLATAAAGRLVLMSTPFGRRGHFWEEWDQGGTDWQRIAVPAEQVPRIGPGFLAAERRALGDGWYRQEYGCAFLEASGGLFRAEDIARALADIPALDLGLDGPGDVAPLRLPSLAPCPS
jgi:hypothetical protein